MQCMEKHECTLLCYLEWKFQCFAMLNVYVINYYVQCEILKSLMENSK